MGISSTPSVITLPPAEPPYPSILDFLAGAFPTIPRAQWQARLAAGKVLDEHSKPIRADTRYLPAMRIFYFREVENEPVIPFAEEILFRNDEILVADKPHFLPVIPGGRFVNECLLQRLRLRTGIADLAPIHRIDRETAGLVVFSVNRATRGLYHQLFLHGRIAKTYEALAALPDLPAHNQWTVENRLVRGEPRFRMQIVPGSINARSRIELLDAQQGIGRFRLHPLTGKTHQLRLHMSSLGFGILNDRVYPELQAQREDDFDRPLQLLAKHLQFMDPVSGRELCVESGRELAGTR